MKNNLALSRLLSLAASLLIAHATAHAASNDIMEKMFNSMINVTPGKIVETQSAGVIAGPSIYVRNKISNIQLASFEPPHFKAGCGGIDLYTGSFSFINKDALIQAARNIASNAVPYAFNLAIGTLCPKCEQYMNDLQKIQNALSQASLNSCKIASTLVDSFAKEPLQDFATYLGIEKGAASDNHAAKNNPTKTATQIIWDADPQQASDELEHNTAWDALTNAKIPTWYLENLANGDDDQFKRMIMTFTGTLITRYEKGADGNVKDIPDTRTIPPTIDFLTFLSDSNASVSIYECDDDDDQCLFPDPTETPPQNITLPSLKALVRKAILGDAEAGELGILNKMTARKASDGLTFTTNEKNFIAAVPGSVLATLRSLASKTSVAKQYGLITADHLAAQMTADLLLDILQNVKLAVARMPRSPISNARDPASIPFMRQLDELSAQVRDQLRFVNERFAHAQAQMQTAALLRANISQNTR